MAHVQEWNPTEIIPFFQLRQRNESAFCLARDNRLPFFNGKQAFFVLSLLDYLLFAFDQAAEVGIIIFNFYRHFNNLPQPGIDADEQAFEIGRYVGQFIGQQLRIQHAQLDITHCLDGRAAHSAGGQQRCHAAEKSAVSDAQ